MAPSKGKSSHTAQMFGSLIVAVLIVVVTISVVTARLGVGEDSGGGSDSEEEDGSGRGRGRGRSDSDLGEPARNLFAVQIDDPPPLSEFGTKHLYSRVSCQTSGEEPCEPRLAPSVKAASADIVSYHPIGPSNSKPYSILRIDIVPLIQQ